MTAGPTPQQLAAGARKALEPAAAWGSAWPRAAAFLARQALEDAVAEIWHGPSAAMRNANFTAQLISLPYFLADKSLAGQVRQCWHSLSNACHAHPYELSPTVAELTSWLDVVDDLVEAVTPA